MQLDGFLPFNNPMFVFIILVWSIFWKGIALWRSAQNHQRNWFLVILIVSSMGIIEIVYLFKFSKKRLTIQEMKNWVKSR